MLFVSSVYSPIRLGAVVAIASQASVGIALASVYGLFDAAFPDLASAQTVTTDGTLPTQVMWDAATNEFNVTGGSAQGNNLFHSFDTFSPSNGSVLFDLTGDVFGSGIERIFSRVTGNNISEINGSLTILGGNSPDLFLLNPNGIVFGPDARLNLAGSFVGTTAKSIQFLDGNDFSAIAPQSGPPLLSVSVPVGLQLGQNPGMISVLGTGSNIQRANPFAPSLQDPAFPVKGLSVSPGQTLALMGGEIQFKGGEIQSVYAPGPNGQIVPLGGAQITLGALAKGSVQLEPGPLGWDISYAEGQAYQNISFTDGAWINAGGLLPGNINLSGQDIDVNGSSLSNSYFGEQLGGDTNIQATGTVKLQGNGSQLSDISEVEVVTLGSGQGGNLNLFAERFLLLDGVNFLTASFSTGDAGRLKVDVAKDLQIDGFSGTSPLSPQVTAIASSALDSGKSGSVDIQAATIRIENGGIVAASNFGSGAVEEVNIQASESVTLKGINPLSQFVSNISSNNYGAGDSVNSLILTTPRLEVLEGALVGAESLGAQNLSEVIINASDLVRVSGSASTDTFPPSRISSKVTKDSPFFREGGLLEETAAAQPALQGNGGTIGINTARLELLAGAEISVANDGIGDAGDVVIWADHISLSDQANIAAATQTGSGGDIELFATEALTLRNRSQISASSGGAKPGGNIKIQTPHLVAVPQENSDISANSQGSQGGNITIQASSVLGLEAQPQLTEASDITASSELGAQFSGTIDLAQPTTNPTSGITALPSSLTQQSPPLTTNACTTGATQLARSGRGGLPRSPNNLLHHRPQIEGENDPINRAIDLRHQGFYAQALDILLSEAESPQTEAASKREAILLHQLGITHKLLRRPKKSRAALKQGLAIAQRLNDTEQASTILLSLGNFKQAENQTERARYYYRQALNQNPSHTLRHQILANQLAFKMAIGENNVAKRVAKDLLKELNKNDLNDPLYLATRLNVAATLLRSKQLDVVPNFLALLHQDLEGAKAAKDLTAIAYALGHLGQAYEQRGQWKKAQQYSEAALQRAQSQHDIFQEYQWAWQLGRITGARWEASGDEHWRSQSKIAYQVALQALQQLRGNLATVSPALQFSFRNRVEPVYREYVNLLLSSDNPQVQPTSTNLNQALDTIEALRLAELDNFFQDSCLETAPQAIQNLDPTAAVIYPIILDDRVEVIVGYQGELQRHTVAIAPEKLENMVRTFQRQLVTRSRRNYQTSSRQLYDWLIHPVVPLLEEAQIETLVIVPDGVLKNIPLAALSDGEQYLIEQFNVAIAPSLQLLPAKDADDLAPHALVAGISQKHQGFSRLPYVEQEMEKVQSLFPGNRLLNQSFTREKLERSLVETQTPIVHIATHGQFSSSAKETFILAWDEQINIDQLRELLQRRNRQNLSPTELLVLSACETAVGDEFAALGLAGMAVRAGARSTLASLWSVNDESTAQLIEMFYQQLAQSSQTKSAALRKAQLAMLEHPRYKHPYYWSAFVLMGNWQ